MQWKEDHGSKEGGKESPYHSHSTIMSFSPSRSIDPSFVTSDSAEEEKRKRERKTLQRPSRNKTLRPPFPSLPSFVSLASFFPSPSNPFFRPGCACVCA
mmetsp:Transcript_37845/g.74422  ORF Transcript_37845/g.74422 Transcript_37845/m.74422 type:complete len:99 (+) Transcript_37845:177-473(+)